jgi:hypothetical protein
MIIWNFGLFALCNAVARRCLIRQTAAQFEGAVQRRKVEGEPSESDRLNAGEADVAAVFATKLPQPVKQNLAFSNFQSPVPVIKQDFHIHLPKGPV